MPAKTGYGRFFSAARLKEESSYANLLSIVEHFSCRCRFTDDGIEYFNPSDLVAAVFLASADQVDGWKFQSDPMEFNDIRKSKKELAEIVTNELTQAPVTLTRVTSERSP